MMLRAILAFLALPTLVAGVFPWLISKLPATDNFQWPYGVVLIVLGGGILLASVISLAARKLLPKAYELAYDRANQEGIPCKSLLPVKQEQTFTG